MIASCMDLVPWPVTIQRRFYLASASMVDRSFAVLMFRACMFQFVHAWSRLPILYMPLESSGNVVRFSEVPDIIWRFWSFCAPWDQGLANHGSYENSDTTCSSNQDVKLQELEDLVEDLRLQRRHRVRFRHRMVGECPQGYSWALGSLV